ncbi:hypothetical protein [Oceanidesulfovibrio marinus]|uniref:Uncharacterized protein n=2 Tax=Oceanidesulfovibrio marinus TaxID=370038 RepID=A0ABX6NCG3_9BACT|nr:hypothetical protein [Oceanidesulfovibrio marinus]QJT08278.1 hypothetical protein E8L03_04755 [Oceanidesulfovibrio marinus]
MSRLPDQDAPPEGAADREATEPSDHQPGASRPEEQKRRSSAAGHRGASASSSNPDSSRNAAHPGGRKRWRLRLSRSGAPVPMPFGQGFLRAVLWGDIVATLALLAPVLDYYQPVVRPYAAGALAVSLGAEIYWLRLLRQGTARAGALLLTLGGLFGFYAVHNFVAAGMIMLYPTWYGVVFVVAGAFFAWASVGLLRLWSRL